MVQLGVLVPRLARAVELAGVLDGLLDLVFGLDDLKGETHRYVPADVAVHPKKRKRGAISKEIRFVQEMLREN